MSVVTLKRLDQDPTNMSFPLTDPNTDLMIEKEGQKDRRMGVYCLADTDLHIGATGLFS